jgi:PTS system mannitol-specific IIC component
MPILIIPLILGGATGVALEQILGGGLQAPASPGSIIMEYIMTPNNLAGRSQLPGTLINYYPGSTYIANTAGMFGAIIVSFIGSALCFKFKKPSKTLQESQSAIFAMKTESKGTPSSNDNLADINLIVFACDAGMGSSAMGSTKLQKMLKENNINGIDVIHKSVSEVPQDAKLIIVHESLKHQVTQKNPNVKIITIKDFMNTKEYKMIVDKLKNNKSVANTLPNKNTNNNVDLSSSKLLLKKCIQINCPAETAEKAIKRVGRLMFQANKIDPKYIAGMIKRDQDVSVAIGNFIAIPHAPNEDRKYIKENSLAVVVYKKPID